MFQAVPWPQVRISGCISVGGLQDVESQAARVTFQLPRGHNAKNPKPEDWRAQALTCEVISSAERETARAPTQRLDTLANNPVKPTQLTFLTQFSSEDREDGRRTRAPTQRLVLCWYQTRQQEHRIVQNRTIQDQRPLSRFGKSP